MEPLTPYEQGQAAGAQWSAGTADQAFQIVTDAKDMADLQRIAD